MAYGAAVGYSKPWRTRQQIFRVPATLMPAAAQETSSSDTQARTAARQAGSETVAALQGSTTQDFASREAPAERWQDASGDQPALPPDARRAAVLRRKHRGHACSRRAPR